MEFFRAVPVLMMMLFAYFGLQRSASFGPTLIFVRVVIGLTFYNASVIAELIRSGVGSLPSGQREAGLAIGMTPTQTLAIVLLPQAITAMLPSLDQPAGRDREGLRAGLHASTTRSCSEPGRDFCTNHGNLIPTLMVAASSSS